MSLRVLHRKVLVVSAIDSIHQLPSSLSVLSSLLSRLPSSSAARPLTTAQRLSSVSTCGHNLVEVSPQCRVEGDHEHFRIITDFVSSDEEQSVLKEVSRAFRRKKYQYDHWDGVREHYVAI